MSTEIILYDQIATTISFVGGVFVLYRLLVQNKEAAIQLLEKRVEHLNDRMATSGSDILFSNLERRISVLSNEIERLNKDKNTSTVFIKEKEHELTHAKEMYERLQKMLMHSSAMSINCFCPECEELPLSKVSRFCRAETSATFSSPG